MRRFLWCICLLPILLGSCTVSSDDFRVNGLEDIDLSSFSHPKLILDVENASGKKLQARDGVLTISRFNGGKVATITLEEKVEVPRRYEGTVEIPLNLKIDDPMLLINSALGGKLRLSNMIVSGEVVVKAGMLRRKIDVKDMPMSQFLSIFGLDESYLENFSL